MSLLKLLTATISIATPGAATKDAYGGWTDEPGKTSYAASVQVDTSEAALEFERQTKKRTFNIYILPTVTPVKGCRVLITSGVYNGTVVDVLSYRADHAGRGTYWMLKGTEVV